MSILQDRLDMYAEENAKWGDVDYLTMCGYRYGDVSDPSHLHCLAYSMALKFEELQVGVEKERQKWIRACLDFGGDDDGSTAHKIMQQGLE